MEEKIVLTEKQDAFNQIYKNFWNVLLYTGLTKQNDMEMIKRLLTTYYGLKHDFAVPIEFLKDMKGNGLYHVEEKQIDVNAKFVHTSKDGYRTIGNIEKLLLTLSHEFSHHDDHMEVDTQRTFIGGRWKSLLKIVETAEDGKRFYDLCKALYDAGRSEVFARQKSYLESLDFLKNVDKYAQDAISNSRFKQLFADFDYDFAFNQCLNQQLSKEDYLLLKAVNNVKILKTHIMQKQQIDELTTKGYRLEKAYLLPQIKRIFEDKAINFFANSSMEEDLGFEAEDIQYVLEIPEFYNEELINMLYHYAKDNQDFEILNRLSKFQMTKEETETHKKIKSTDKNPIKKIDLFQGYTSYKKRKLNKNNFEKN